VNVSGPMLNLCGVVAAQPLVVQAQKVNGAPLTKSQARLIQYFAKDVQPNVPRRDCPRPSGRTRFTTWRSHTFRKATTARGAIKFTARGMSL
jgi:hypothetical protein